IIGRSDLLRVVDTSHPLAPDLAALLINAKARRRHNGYRRFPASRLAERISADASEAIRTGEPIELAYPIENIDRTVGARLSGEIVALHGDAGLPEDTIRIRLHGTAGQSFGAWLIAGVRMDLAGTANDFVAKGMAGGSISVAPPRPG